MDRSGNIFIADNYNNRIRKVAINTGFISTIAGTGTPGFNGDYILATSAAVNSPRSVYLDLSGNILIGDAINNRIRMISNHSGT